MKNGTKKTDASTIKFKQEHINIRPELISKLEAAEAFIVIAVRGKSLDFAIEGDEATLIGMVLQALVQQEVFRSILIEVLRTHLTYAVMTDFKNEDRD